MPAAWYPLSHAHAPPAHVPWPEHVMDAQGSPPPSVPGCTFASARPASSLVAPSGPEESGRHSAPVPQLAAGRAPSQPASPAASAVASTSAPRDRSSFVIRVSIGAVRHDPFLPLSPRPGVRRLRRTRTIESTRDRRAREPSEGSAGTSSSAPPARRAAPGEPPWSSALSPSRHVVAAPRSRRIREVTNRARWSRAPIHLIRYEIQRLSRQLRLTSSLLTAAYFEHASSRGSGRART